MRRLALSTPARRLALAAAAALVLGACGGDGDDPSPTATPAGPAPTPAFSSTEVPRGDFVAAAGSTIKIGVSVSLSGATAAMGQDIRDAVTLAVEDHDGSIAGLTVEADAQDDGCNDPKKPSDVAQRFGQDKAVIAVVGPMCNDGEFAAGLVYNFLSIIHVSPSATRPLPGQRRVETFFRTAWRDDAQGIQQSRYAYERLGARKAFVVDDAEEYGQAIAYNFALEFIGQGGEVAGHAQAPAGATDLKPVVDAVLASAPDVVAFEGFAAGGAALLKALRDAGYSGAFIGPDGLFDVAKFVEAAGPAAEGAVVVAAAPLPADFVERFTERFGRAPSTPFVAHAYDATQALLAAIESAAQVADDGSVTVGRAKLREALLATDLDGLSGALRFDQIGDRVGATASELGLAFYEVRDGAFELVEDGD